jgi:hypothetical protein
LNDEYEEILDELFPEAFAVVVSACQRLVGKSWTVAGNKLPGIWFLMMFS